jgi:haloacetate dehalogenase
MTENKVLGRRRFLTISGATGLGLLSSGLLGANSGPATSDGDPSASPDATADPKSDKYAGLSSESFFPGYESFKIKTKSGITINGVRGGSGPPLLLLHGAPVNLASWRKVAPLLQNNYTIIATDLRGYGDSDMPDGGTNHENYAFRLMARDQVEVMNALGYSDFHLVAHDRGARVARRLTLDNPVAVKTLTILDILPGLYFYDNIDKAFAEAYWFWLMFTAPAPVPENWINCNPVGFMTTSFFGRRDVVEQTAFDNFVRTMVRDGASHAACEDYRAAATIDLEDDRADFATKIECPVLVLWGKSNPLYSKQDVLKIWRERATDVRGHGVDSNHWIPEIIPEELAQEIMAFAT